MLLNNGSGREDEGGPYVKASSGPLANKGTVYVVAGNAGRPVGTGTLDHPAMYISLLELGSVIIDVNENRLDARELRPDGIVRDRFTIIKEPRPALQIAHSGSEVAVSWPASQTTSCGVQPTYRRSLRGRPSRTAAPLFRDNGPFA